MNKTTFIAVFVFLSITLLVIYKKNKSTPNTFILKETSVILAFGDSLTYGFGAEPASSYPKWMERKTGLKIINAGINGELTREGLLRLPTLLKHNPDLVILCHGGNDILNKVPFLEMKNNLLAMIKILQERNIKVLLVGIPDFSLFGFGVHGVYTEIANETDVLFEDNILTHIELNRSLKSDYVHPNAKGYEMMADAFIEVLKI